MEELDEELLIPKYFIPATRVVSCASSNGVVTKSKEKFDKGDKKLKNGSSCLHKKVDAMMPQIQMKTRNAKVLSSHVKPFTFVHPKRTAIKEDKKLLEQSEEEKQIQNLKESAPCSSKDPSMVPCVLDEFFYYQDPIISATLMPPDLSATIFKCETAKSIALDFSKMKKEFEKEQVRRTELKKELEDVQVQSLKREYMEYCEVQKLEKSMGKAATERSSGCGYATKMEWFHRVFKEQAKFPELRQHGCETTVEYDLWISQRIHQLIHGISEREIQIIDVPGMGMLRYDGSKNNVSKVPFLSHDNILEDQERSPDGFGSSKIRKVNESAPLPYTAKPRVIHTRANCPLPSDNFPVKTFSYPDHLHTACQPINILPVTTYQKSQVPAKPRRAIRITHLNSLSELDRRRAELLLPSERLRRSSTVAQRPESLGGHQHHMLERDRLLELTEDDWCQCNHCQEVIHPGQNLDDVLGK